MAAIQSVSSSASIHFTRTYPLLLWKVLLCYVTERGAQCSVQGATYHGPGLADGHQASEEVFIVQLAENMGVIGYHNGDFFHHLAS